MPKVKPTATMYAIDRALRPLVLPTSSDLEADIDEAVSEQLTRCGIAHEREVQFTLRRKCKMDFLCESGVVIEVKRGAPNMAKLAEQIARYLESPLTTGAIALVEKSCRGLPSKIHGKPVFLIRTNAAWGVTL